jgi:hypothetical protein
MSCAHEHVHVARAESDLGSGSMVLVCGSCRMMRERSMVGRHWLDWGKRQALPEAFPPSARFVLIFSGSHADAISLGEPNETHEARR